MRKLFITLIVAALVQTAFAQEQGGWKKKVLVEEFTTESCPNCPPVANALQQLITSNPDIHDQIAVVCHHVGYGTDWLTLSTDKSYLRFFGGQYSSYAPALMFDRYWFPENTDPDTGNGPAEFVNTAAGMKQHIETRLAEPAHVGLEVSAQFDAEKLNIDVDVTCRKDADYDAPLRLTLMVTEDNIEARNQSGASGKFVHQHVNRAVNQVWGEPLTWEDNTATYHYRFKLKTSWGREDLKVVAFVSSYNIDDRNDCVVDNTEVVVPTEATGIVSTIRDDATVTGRYTIDGQKATSSHKGLTIVKLSDGTVRKEIVR